MRSRLLICAVVFCCVLGTGATLLQASYVYPFEVFTSNGGFYDSSGLILRVEVSNGVADEVDFVFYNESLFESCIAVIYFEDNSLFDAADVNNGPGTLFRQFAKPENLPAGRAIEPLFIADEEFCFDAEAPPPKNGVNPNEWVRITVGLKSGHTFADLIDELDTGNLRIGTHIIALPDGSSESAITVPEPLTFALVMMGGLALMRKRRT